MINIAFSIFKHINLFSIKRYNRGNRGRIICISQIWKRLISDLLLAYLCTLCPFFSDFVSILSEPRDENSLNIIIEINYNDWILIIILILSSFFLRRQRSTISFCYWQKGKVRHIYDLGNLQHLISLAAFAVMSGDDDGVGDAGCNGCGLTAVFQSIVFSMVISERDCGSEC